MKELPIASNKFCSSATKDYYAHIFSNKKIEFRLLNICENVDKKNRSSLNTNKEDCRCGSNYRKISERCCRFVRLSITHKLPTNLSVKLSVFSEECKIAELNPLFKTNSKNTRSILLLPVVSKIIEKSIH